jgi:hypothetical protein
MSVRSTLLDAGRRMFGILSRGVVTKVDDTKKRQTVDISMWADEKRVGVERFQQYGMTTVPHPPKNNQAAEHIVLFLGNQRGHSVVLAVEDRRYRLTALKNGEMALYDDQAHQVHISRNGIVISAPKSKKVLYQVMQSDDPPKPESGQGYQGAQAGKPAIGDHTLDQNGHTMTHKKNITLNAQVKVHLQAPTIVHAGTLQLGAETGAKPVGILGSVDTAGDELIGNLAANTNAA